VLLTHVSAAAAAAVGGMNKGDVKIYWPININAPMTFKLAYFCSSAFIASAAIFAIQVFGATARINVTN